MKTLRMLLPAGLCWLLLSCAPEEAAKAPAAPGKKEPPKVEAAKPAPEEPGQPHQRGAAAAEVTRPKHFPHRIWAACDFEGRTFNYGWFGSEEKQNIPKYPGNQTALRGKAHSSFAWYTGINPVPGPRMDVVNYVYFRYYIKGTDKAQVQHFNLSKNDNHHIRVSGLTAGKWSELTLNFTRDSKRNDGSPGAMVMGDRMDDLKVFLGRKGDGKEYELLLDDIIFFSERPGVEPDPEPFPKRVIFLAAFDTGEKEKYWPGEFEITTEGEAPPGSYWRVAKAVTLPSRKMKGVSLEIKPPKPLGRSTCLRYRYYLKNATGIGASLGERDSQGGVNAGVTRMTRPPQLEQWVTRREVFSPPASTEVGGQRRELFQAGSLVARIEFVAESAPGEEAELYIDEVVLYDTGEKQ